MGQDECRNDVHKHDDLMSALMTIASYGRRLTGTRGTSITLWSEIMWLMSGAYATVAAEQMPGTNIRDVFEAMMLIVIMQREEPELVDKTAKGRCPFSVIQVWCRLGFAYVRTSFD